jgi:hypothetical protein
MNPCVFEVRWVLPTGNGSRSLAPSLVLAVQLLAIFAGGLVVMTAASHQASRRLVTYLP